MLFFVVLQFCVTTAMVLLVLFQNSEDVVSDFTSSRSGSNFAGNSSSPLSKVTWFCALVFFTNTIVLSSVYSPKAHVSKVLQQEEFDAKAALALENKDE